MWTKRSSMSHLSAVSSSRRSVSCIDTDNLADEKGVCKDTPKTRLPDWIRESVYFKDPVQGPEGGAGGVPGTNPAGWMTYGRGLPPSPPKEEV